MRTWIASSQSSFAVCFSKSHRSLFVVIPAESGKSIIPSLSKVLRVWVPAFAGTTRRESQRSAAPCFTSAPGAPSFLGPRAKSEGMARRQAQPVFQCTHLAMRGAFRRAIAATLRLGAVLPGRAIRPPDPAGFRPRSSGPRPAIKGRPPYWGLTVNRASRARGYEPRPRGAASCPALMTSHDNAPRKDRT